MKKLFLFIVLFYAISTVKSQWNNNLDQNLQVIDPGLGSSAFSARMSDGKTYLGFWKKVAAPVNFELWIQILDQNGYKQLGTDGVMLSNQIPMGSYTFVERTALDSSDNFYIGITATGAGTNGYVFKVTPQGTSVWPNGINLGEGYLPTILPLSNGDVLVSYWPSSLKYTKVQRFNASGQAVWTSPVTIMSDDITKNTAPADIFELPNNEFEIIFSKVMTGTNSYLFAQKLNFDGTILWNIPKQITTKTTSWNIKYQGVVDGSVVYYGFSSGQGGRFDGYLQRINSDGSLPWGATGSDFDTNQTNYEKDMKIAYSPGSSYIWSIANYTTSSQGENGEYVQKFNKNTGARLFTNNAKQVFPIDNNSVFHAGNLHLLNDQPFFVVQKKIGQSAINISLNAVLLDDNGDFAWSQQFQPMAIFPAKKTYITSLKPINGQSVLVFMEQKSTDANPNVYAQNLMLPTLGTDEVNTDHSSVSIYPNPVTEVINVKGLQDQKYIIFNAASQLVKRGEMKQGQIMVQDLSKGIYILKVEKKNEGYKFIKK